MPGAWLEHVVNTLERVLPSLDLAAAVVAQRTAVMDELLIRSLGVDGFDAVLKLVAGFDFAPYRLPLPRRLRWLDVDLPEVIADRRSLFGGGVANCQLETITLDPAVRAVRHAFFHRLNGEGWRVLVLTEELLLSLALAEVAALASELFAQSSFALWPTDLM
jgi:O-methyltransferase involved in polyketide biosynthesis